MDIIYTFRYLFLILNIIGCLNGIITYKYQTDELELDLAKAEGLSSNSEISSESLDKIIKGVENKNKDSVYFYGLLKLYGISLSKDPSIAAQYFLQASKLGHKDGASTYGMCLMSGNGVERDHIKAKYYFQKAIEMGDMNSYWLLGKLLIEQRGDISNENYIQAATFFRSAVEAKIPQGCYHLALLYEYGHGVEQNYDLAIKYYERAVEQNHIDAMYNLALIYTYGRGVIQDFSVARSLLEKAASYQHAPSIYYIGIFKTYGYGTEVNYEQAINWFERVASIDDFRVNSKAKKAAIELKNKLEYANNINNENFHKYVEQSINI